MRPLPIVAILVGLLASCTTTEPPPKPRIVPLPSEPGSSQDAEKSTAPDPAIAFCEDLMRVIDAREAGFAAFRGVELSDRKWHADFTPEAFSSCEIEGRSSVAAIYSCAGRPRSQRAAEDLIQSFERLESWIDSCLAAPTWYPREWRRGRLFAFAGAERQLMWRDVTSRPAPAVILAVSENISSSRLHLSLRVRSLR